MKRTKIILKITAWIFLIFFLSTVAGVATENWVFPWLASFPSMSRFQFLQKINEKTTIINKTEQVVVKEDSAVSDIAEKIAPSLVSVLAFTDAESAGPIKIVQDERMNLRAGVLITSDGLVLSLANKEIGNYYLQNKKIKFKILFPNGSDFDASLAGYDFYSNLLFYKIEKPGNWSAPILGDSKKLASGDQLVICSSSGKEGQPDLVADVLRLKENNFSLLNSELSFSEKMEGAFFLGSKDGIDEKNVGSPVVNSAGELVGIAGLVEKNNQKIGFVLPLELVEKTLERMIKNEGLERPALGVYYLPIDKKLAIANNLSVTEGALVYSFSGQQGLAVLKNSSADKAGVKIGDIITEFAGEKITAEHSLSGLLSEKKKGETVKLKLLRNKQELEVSAVLE